MKTTDPVVFKTGGEWPFVLAGAPFFLFGLFFLWKAVEVYGKNPSAGFVVGGAVIGLLFAAFGATLIFLRLTTVIDPSSRTVSKQRRFLFFTHQRKFFADSYDTVLLEEKIQDNGRRRFQFFRVGLSCAKGGAETLFIDQDSDYALARSKADALASCLGFKLIDRGCGEEGAVPSEKMPLDLKQPASSQVVVREEDETLSIHIPRRRFDNMHRLYLVLIFLSAGLGGLTMMWVAAQFPPGARASLPGMIFLFGFSAICFAGPSWGSFLCLRSATRRYDVILEEDKLRMRTQTFFGEKTVMLLRFQVKDIQVRRSQYTVRVPGLENHVLRIVGDDLSVEMGSGLTRNELLWLREVIRRELEGRP